MILFAILAIIALIVLIVAIALISVGGAGFIVIFGDLIVCVAIIVFIIKLLSKRRKRR